MQFNNDAFIYEDENYIVKVVFGDFNRFNRSNHTSEHHILFWEISQV